MEIRVTGLLSDVFSEDKCHAVSLKWWITERFSPRKEGRLMRENVTGKFSKEIFVSAMLPGSVDCTFFGDIQDSGCKISNTNCNEKTNENQRTCKG